MIFEKINITVFEKNPCNIPPQPLKIYKKKP